MFNPAIGSIFNWSHLETIKRVGMQFEVCQLMVQATYWFNFGWTYPRNHFVSNFPSNTERFYSAPENGVLTNSKRSSQVILLPRPF